ncbi:hypothetical protein ACEPAF_9710 [Sanghuangporus sanghuang]
MASPSRLSIDSQSSRHSDRSSPSSSNLSDHSTSALILVHESEDEEQSFVIADGEDIPEDVSTPGDDLSPSVAFGYFLSPHLKLGSMLVLSSQAPLKLSIPVLLVFAFLSAFSRQIWFLSARYIRPDLNEIVAEAVARGRGKERQRSIAKALSCVLSAVMRILLATVYLKGAISCMEPLWPSRLSFIPSPLALSVIFLLVASPISLSPMLASKRLVYSTGVSNALYIVWLCIIIYAHAAGVLNTDNVMVPQGQLLDDITAVAFAFSSVSNLHIYSGLASQRGTGDRKERRYLSISSISFAATLVGTCLILPVLFPSVKSHGEKESTEISSFVKALLATVTAFILLLAIPPLITTSPAIIMPFTLAGVSRRTVGKYAYLVVLFVLSLLPRALEPVLEDTAVLLVLLSTYFLPALLHIVVHIIRRPTSILVDRPLLHHTSGVVSDDEEVGAFGYDRETEELLLRKERALQRRRLGRRIMWDLGVWILLFPVGGGGMVWAIGRLVHAW